VRERVKPTETLYLLFSRRLGLMSRDGKTLLVICQVYPPDPAAVGQHVADLAEHMTNQGWRVIVYASARGYENPMLVYAARERRSGVDVCRLPLSSFGKGSLARRLIGGGLFLLQATIRGLFNRRLDCVLVSTSPPFAGFGGAVLAMIRRVPMIWWVMDINPDQLIVAGKTRPSSLAVRVFEWFNRLTLRVSKAVVVLDRYMAERILAKHPVAAKLHEVPPWPPDDSLGTQPAAGHRFRQAHGLEGKFVVMYSGNHALQHPLSTLLAAARSLSADPSLVFVFIGSGAGKNAVDQAVTAGARNIVSLPFQPLAEIGESLAAADVHVVTMGDEVVGIVHPSKIYGAMAVGRPILFFGPEASHCGELLAGQSFGRVIRHGDTAAAVRAISEFQALPLMARVDVGSAAAAVCREQFSKARQLSRIAAIVESV
jgi:colanic acid biosynthesis glycosyl transferase WcaI